MKVRKAIPILVLSLLIIILSCKQDVQGNRDVFSEPQLGKEPRYINPLPIERAGYLADPAVIRIKEKYYLYATGGLAWSSDDLLHWNYHRVEMPEGSILEAPAAFVYKGYVYLTGNDTGLYRSRNPLGPFEYIGDFIDEKGRRLERGRQKGWENGGVFDPMIFVDSDERVYLYYAGGSIHGIYGVELDPRNLRKFLSQPKHFFGFNPSHKWERYGNRNEYSHVSWIEGPWMSKRNGTYYLQYSASGTDWRSYAVGVYTSKKPLGPFTYYEGSPILIHRKGMINGCGHHCVVEGPEGTWWVFYTMLYRNWNREVVLERRIGMDPLGFDDQGNIFINGPSETPQWAPGIMAKPWEGNDSGSIPLSEDKSYRVSSEAPGRNAPYAFDNNVRTWWAWAENDPEPWLILDLAAGTREDPQQEFLIDSARILFLLPSSLNQEGTPTRIRKYKIEVSSDGQTFTTVVDKSNNNKDNAVEFDEIGPVRSRYVKLIITGWPKDLPGGVIEFTVFGRPGNNK